MTLRLSADNMTLTNATGKRNELVNSNENHFRIYTIDICLFVYLCSDGKNYFYLNTTTFLSCMIGMGSDMITTPQIQQRPPTIFPAVVNGTTSPYLQKIQNKTMASIWCNKTSAGCEGLLVWTLWVRFKRPVSGNPYLTRQSKVLKYFSVLKD